MNEQRPDAGVEMELRHTVVMMERRITSGHGS